LIKKKHLSELFISSFPDEFIDFLKRISVCSVASTELYGKAVEFAHPIKLISHKLLSAHSLLHDANTRLMSANCKRREDFIYTNAFCEAENSRKRECFFHPFSLARRRLGEWGVKSLSILKTAEFFLPGIKYTQEKRKRV
jgi:hypothetical protein